MAKLLSGGGNNAAALLQQASLSQQLQQQQAELRNQQGQQLALLSKDQATKDAETASLSRPGLGRALLAYSNKTQSQTLGG